MMEKRVFHSVWDALEDSPEQATNMRLRSESMIALHARVEAWNTTRARAAKRLRITRPRLNDLLRSRIDRFSLDALVGWPRMPDSTCGSKVRAAA
jgi:predicted XRE-type DNA-binding protein